MYSIVFLLVYMSCNICTVLTNSVVNKFDFMYRIVFLHVYMPCEFSGPNKNEINGRSNKKTTLLLRNVANCNERKMESCSLKYSNYVLIFHFFMWLL
jgi:hypothetical protein